MHLGLGPGSAGGLSVRAKEPAERARGRGGGGGQGGAKPSGGPKQPAGLPIRNSLGMNSGVPHLCPGPPTVSCLGPPAGWRHGQACPDPRPILNPSGVGPALPLLPPLPPLPSPTHHHSQARKGRSGGPGWRLGQCPLPHPPGLGWCGLPASSCSCLLGLGGGRGERARPGGLGQASPPTQLQQERSWEAFSS